MAENNVPDAAAHATSTLRLTPFWPDAPNSWFQMAEAQFHLRGVTADYDKYCLLLASLPKESFRMVSHLVELDGDRVADDAYTQLKRALVSSHIMSDYKKVELLSRVEPLGGWRPSELLATMLELCPRGHEASPFFAYLFLQRLPREIRVLLADDDTANMRAIAEKADRYLALHTLQAHESSLAAITQPAESEEDDTVAAATAQQRGKRWKKKNFSKRGKQQQQQQKSTSICTFHLRYGEKARKYEEPCSWPENK
jgi:hypothetical protein